MNQERNEETIFKAAIKIRSAEKRTAYVEQACGGDPGLLARVKRLLKSHEEAGSFLESQPFGANVTLDTSPMSEGPGTEIGRGRICDTVEL